MCTIPCIAFFTFTLVRTNCICAFSIYITWFTQTFIRIWKKTNASWRFLDENVCMYDARRRCLTRCSRGRIDSAGLLDKDYVVDCNVALLIVTPFSFKYYLQKTFQIQLWPQFVGTSKWIVWIDPWKRPRIHMKKLRNSLPIRRRRNMKTTLGSLLPAWPVFYHILRGLRRKNGRIYVCTLSILFCAMSHFLYSFHFILWFRGYSISVTLTSEGLSNFNGTLASIHLFFVAPARFHKRVILFVPFRLRFTFSWPISAPFMK